MLDLFDHHLEIKPEGAIEARALPAHGGVYLVVDADERPVLLASGEDLRRVVSSRLAGPLPDQRTKRANLAEIAARVHWKETFSRFETALVHWQAARRLYPKSYRDLILFSPAWFLRLDLNARTPAFETVCEFEADGARYFGPVVPRSKAVEWTRMLEDLFDLCRYRHILEQAPHGQACAYFDMGRCPAPCNGSLSLDEYRRMLIAAADFTAGAHQPRLEQLRQAMQAAAASLAFEKAETIRQISTRAAAMVQEPEYHHLRELSRCCWLIVQRAGPRRRSPKNLLVKPFFLRAGAIEAGSPIPLTELDATVPRWLARCGPCSVLPPASPEEQTARCEILWLVSKFLYQGEQAPGVFLPFDRLSGASEVIRHVGERCGRPEQPDTVGQAE